MTKQDKLDRIIEVATLCHILTLKIDYLRENNVSFRHELKRSANMLQKECIRLCDWFWADTGGDAGLMEIFKLQDALETIGRVLVDFSPTKLDAVENFIKTLKNISK